MLSIALFNPQIIQPIQNFSGYQYINRIVPVLIYVGIVLCVIAFIILLIVGGIQYITSGGDKPGLEGGRNKIVNAITGLIVLLLLWLILQFINWIFGINIGNLGPPNWGGPRPTPGAMGCDNTCTSFTDFHINDCDHGYDLNNPPVECTTPVNTATLYLGWIYGADQVQIQNFSNIDTYCNDDLVDWSGVTPQPYSNGMTVNPWALTSGLGNKKVCGRFLNPNGETTCCGGMINVYDELYPPQMLLHYALDEGSGTLINDSSGNGFNGTLNDVSMWRSEGCGNSSIYSSGTGPGEVDGPPITQTEAFMSPSFTYAAWIRKTGVGGTGNDWNLIADTDRDVAFGFSGTRNWLEAYVGWDDIPGMNCLGSGTHGINLERTIAIPDNEWHHAALTYNFVTKEAKLYYDGIEAASAASVDSVDPWCHQTLNTAFAVGHGVDAYRRFIGNIDDVRVYNYALSASEIGDLLNCVVQITPTPTPLPTCHGEGDQCGIGWVWACCSGLECVGAIPPDTPGVCQPLGPTPTPSSPACTSCSTVIDQNSYTTGFAIGVKAQSFTQTCSGNIDYVEVCASSSGGPYNIQLRNGEDVNGTVLGTATVTDTGAACGLYGWATWFRGTFSPSVSVVGSVLYTIRFDEPGPTMHSAWISALNPYSGGRLRDSTGWSNVSDYMFRVHACP